jgi:hypothetical protein
MFKDSKIPKNRELSTSRVSSEKREEIVKKATS